MTGTVAIDEAQERANYARFQRRLSTRDQIDRLYRRPVTVRGFYLTTTALARANPWEPAPRWFGQYSGSRKAQPVVREYGGLAA